MACGLTAALQPRAGRRAVWEPLLSASRCGTPETVPPTCWPTCAQTVVLPTGISTLPFMYHLRGKGAAS